MRHSRGALLLVLILAATGGCGKRGPPRAPIVRVPERVAAVTSRRLGDEVVVRFTIPTANANGQGPADIERVDVYAYTGSASGEESIDILKHGAVVGSVKVRKPPEPEEEDRKRRRDKDKEKKDSKEPPTPPPPPEPKPPGTFDQGEVVTIVEALTPALLVPDKAVIAEREKLAKRGRAPVFSAFRWPGPTELPRRYYVAIAVSSKGRKSGVSPRGVIPIVKPVSAPTIADFPYNETTITVLLKPPPDAPRRITGQPADVVPVVPIVPEPAVPPALPTPKPAPAIEPLASRSIVPNRPPVAYNIYDAKATGLDALKPLNPQPLDAPIFVDTRLEFGTERCYVARTVMPVSLASPDLVVESEPSETKCVTPADIFPPVPPRNLAAVGGEGVISLIWEPNTETDLGGYLVLRGEAPGEKLLPLTPAPIRETTFRDTTVKPGTRYVYVVQAVDNATPPNVSAPSNRVEEAAR